MQMVILAGGLGTRLRSVAPDTPKSLVPVAGKPFIEHQFDLIQESGLEAVLLCVGHFGEEIRNHVGSGSRFGLRVNYVEEQAKRLLGTGGALVNALPKLADAFLVMYGDSYLPIHYGKMAEWFQSRSWPAVMSVYQNRELWDKSNTRIEGEKVVFYSKSAKRGEADYIDYGVSVYRKPVIAGYSDAAMPLDLATIQSDLVARGELGAYVVTQRFYEIGKPEGLVELDAFLRKGKA